MPLFLLPFIGWARSALGSVFQFLSTPLGMRIAAALGLVLGFWWWGHHQYASGVSHQLELDAEAAANINSGQVKIVEKLRTVYVPQEAKIKTVTQTIVKEVPVYVTKQDDARCVINNGFVRLHDGAAKGELPGGPTGDDGNPSGVELSTVAQTVTGNYGTCHLALSRLKEWQEWYSRNRALWNGNSK